MLDSLDPPQLTAADIASRFESLGGGGLHPNGWAFGCEFGFFQRVSGVDRPGLLRWVSINSDNLLRGLREGFVGIENPEHTALRDHGGREWGVTQTTYGMYLDHTGMARQQFAGEVVVLRMARLLGRLRDRLVEDLTAGEKLFVYRTYDHIVPDERVQAIADAISQYGPGTLVYVRNDGEPFTTKRVAPNLIVAYIDHFVPGGGRLNWNDAGWERVCRTVLEVSGQHHHMTTRTL